VYQVNGIWIIPIAAMQDKYYNFLTDESGGIAIHFEENGIQSGGALEIEESS
jgi:hypothetical protein